MRRRLIASSVFFAFALAAAILLRDPERGPAPAAPQVDPGSNAASLQATPTRAPKPDPIRSRPLVTETPLDAERVEALHPWFEERALSLQKDLTRLMITDDDEARARMRTLMENFRREAQRQASRTAR